LLRVAAVENFRLYFSLLGYSLNTRPLLMIWLFNFPSSRKTPYNMYRSAF
jgi:hypothetical protein